VKKADSGDTPAIRGAESSAPGVLASLRRWLLALVAFGLCGTLVELVLLGHYEDSWQLVPLFLIPFALVAVATQFRARSAGSVYLLRVAMTALIVAGVLGAVLHYRGNLEFQLEMDRTQSRWQIFSKAIRAKTPPALAPGVMAQLGLLGLLSTYRHASTGRRTDPSREREA
jgi:hypothetical protein